MSHRFRLRAARLPGSTAAPCIDFPADPIDNPLSMVSVYARIFPWFLQIIELLLILAVAARILLSPPPTRRPFQRWFRTLTHKTALCYLILGLGVLFLRIALIPILGVPQPGAHDEFSYLLAADTFAHGRLTNPTPPAWQHFESFHIILRPTYQSMYPPGQGLLLAAGQRLGHPWIGQLVMTAVLCPVMLWALRGWLPPAWALFGACLAAIRLAILGYWMNGYWSGSLVALGGAFLLGAWPRLKKEPRVRESVLLALGLALLANTRPYEGLIYSLPFALAMLLWLVSPRRPSARDFLIKVALPLVLVLAPTVLATAKYYESVTGSPFRLTYQINRSTYAMAPYFLWSSPRPEPGYSHVVMRDFYRRDIHDFQEQQTLSGFFQHTGRKIAEGWRFYLGPLLTLPLLAFLCHLQDRRTTFPLLVVVVTLLGLLPETWVLPHYFAPATAAFYVLLVQGFRHMAQWRWRGIRIGPACVRSTIAIACVMILFRVVAAAAHIPIEFPWPRGNLARARILRQLESIPGQHVVIVQYGPNHNLDSEWVYNQADLESSRVLWARDMGPANAELKTTFPNRDLWIVEADAPQPIAMPIP